MYSKIDTNTKPQHIRTIPIPPTPTLFYRRLFQSGNYNKNIFFPLWNKLEKVFILTIYIIRSLNIIIRKFKRNEAVADISSNCKKEKKFYIIYYIHRGG